MINIFVAEIEGRAIAAMGARDMADAEEWFHGEPFKEDLSVLEDSGGKTIWDDVSEIVVRKASQDEIDQWKRSREAADAEDDDWVVFLIPVTDPTDNDPDKDN